MSKRSHTTRTTNLGLRILQGEERRRVVDFVSFQRAEFEHEYAGKPIVPFDREAVVRSVLRYLDETYVNVSDELVKDCQAKVAYWVRALEREAEAGR